MSEYTAKAANAITIVAPFIEQIASVDDVQVLGGIGTAALGHPLAEIHTNQKEVHVPADFFLPAHREDGTKRDIDILVLSSDKARVCEVESIIENTVDGALDHSVFGIRPHDVLQKQLAHPLGYRAFRTFLSDRYEANTIGEGYSKSLFPFTVPIDPASLETWNLVIGDDALRIPIPHIGTAPLNYSNRSISGVRPRDIDKMTFVTENILERAPEVREWIYDGPGASQLELSRIIASLRFPNQKNKSLLDGIKVDTYSREQLLEHEAFAVEASTSKKRLILAEAAFKAAALHSFESHPSIVTLWRQVAEKRVDGIIKNF